MVTTSSFTGVLDRQVPFNLEAEVAVLGSLLIDRDAIIKIAPFLKPIDFYTEAHSVIYEAMVDLYNRREPGDFVTLDAELRRLGKSDFIGGPAYLTSLAAAVPTSVHIEYYARIVERTAVLRRLISTGGQIASLGYREDEDVEQVLDEAEQLLFGVTQRQTLQDFVVIKQVLENFFDRIDELHQSRGEIVGVPTGFVDLDQLTGGLQPSDLIIVAARPSVGKSSFCFGIAYNAAVRAGKKIGIFSLEMSREQLAQRMLAMETGIDTHRLRLGLVNDDEWHLISSAFGTLAQAPIYIDDTPGLSVSELRSRARRLHAQAGCDLLIVDYLQLMQGRRGGSDNRVQEVSEITRGLKLLARELNVPVIACAQLSRAVESRQSHIPMLSDLRESGSIEQDADIVMFIYREELYEPDTEKKGIAEIHVAKHRNGPTDVVRLLFQKETTRFVDLETHYHPE
jgi:replicative DNA helicase